jgi:hypothetical protein
MKTREARKEGNFIRACAQTTQRKCFPCINHHHVVDSIGDHVGQSMTTTSRYVSDMQPKIMRVGVSRTFGVQVETGGGNCPPSLPGSDPMTTSLHALESGQFGMHLTFTIEIHLLVSFSLREFVMFGKLDLGSGTSRSESYHYSWSGEEIWLDDVPFLVL